MNLQQLCKAVIAEADEYDDLSDEVGEFAPDLICAWCGDDGTEDELEDAGNGKFVHKKCAKSYWQYQYEKDNMPWA